MRYVFVTGYFSYAVKLGGVGYIFYERVEARRVRPDLRWVALLELAADIRYATLEYGAR
jgi:hypothetical protein